MTPSLILAVAGAYLVGSVPTAYLLVKWMRHVDVRTVGSGNVGATNAARIGGLGIGVAVFLIDVGKGWLAVQALVPWLVGDATSATRLGCGLAAVIGHSFPVFLNFRGGKGVATTIGVLVGTMPLVAAVCLAVWGVCVLMWRYVSVGSLAAAATLPLMQLATRQPLPDVLLGVALALLVAARHRANIERLLQGREHRVGRPSSPQSGD